MPVVEGGGGANVLNREQLRNAAIIYKVGMQLGASQRDIQIALITALTESNLINVNYGDRDSLGLFQQRAAWGSVAQRMDPASSARMFFLGGHQGQRGLFDFKNRDRMGMGEAAQAVQVSAFPDRYAQQIDKVRGAWTNIQKSSGAAVTDMDGDPYGSKPNQPDLNENPTLAAPEFEALKAPEFQALKAPQMDDTGSIINPGTNDLIKQLMGQNGQYGKGIDGRRGAILEAARDLIGTPYVWGGTGKNGVDCSGLVQYVFGKFGIEMPRVSYQQANQGRRVGLNALKPGDLVAWDNSSRNNGADHIAIYLGGGRIIEAPRPGLSVRVRKLGRDEGAWGVALDI